MSLRINPRTRATVSIAIIGSALMVAAIVIYLPSIQKKWVDLRTPRSSATVVDPHVPITDPVSSVPFPRVDRFRLKNGLRVLVLEDHRLPRITMRLIFPAGRVYEAIPGTAELTDEMLTEGTKTRTANQLADGIEQLGASVSWTWDRDQSSLELTGLSEYSSDLLSLLSDMGFHSCFPSDRLELKKRLHAPNDMEFQGAHYIAESVAAQALYGEDPYGYLPATSTDIQAIQQSDIDAFYRMHYGPGQAILAVAGDIKAETLHKLAEKDMGSNVSSEESTPLPVAEFPSNKSDAPQVDLIDWKYDKEAYVSLQCLAVAQNDPDFFPLLVMNRILGGLNTSRMGEDLREDRGFTYGSMSSFHAPSRWPGIWSADATVPVDQAEITVQDMCMQIERLRNEPVSDEDLQRSKNGLIGGYTHLLELPEQPLSIAVAIEQAGLPESVYESYTQRIAQVSRADIQRVAAKYFQPNRMHIVVVGPRDRLDSALAPFGKITHYDHQGTLLL